ncbi:MAG: NAD-dependent epimerase/dehydratase family protein [Bacteroidia bacterium]
MRILITGGAGFIGSNLVEAFLKDPRISFVRVLDNFATGYLKNIQEFIKNEKFEFIEGDIRDKDICIKACNGIDAITHQAALGSVPRSIKDPITSHDVNVNGFLNMLEAAKINHIKRFIYASSSSVYGDLVESPKVETKVGKVLSPYAATKMANELYAEAYARNYDMTLVGMRYFNVFGPKQDPNGPYAAVIPLFIKAALTNTSPIINGDGSITRDFTPIQNVIQINTNSIFINLETNKHYVFNVACGQATSLNQLWQMIKEITGTSVNAIYGKVRPGDILFSLADITYAKNNLDYFVESDLYKSLKITINYYKKNGY